MRTMRPLASSVDEIDGAVRALLDVAHALADVFGAEHLMLRNHLTVFHHEPLHLHELERTDRGSCPSTREEIARIEQASDDVAIDGFQ